MSEVSSPAQRSIPGAPPPAGVPKSQKKKRKTGKKATDQDDASIPDIASAALVEEAPKPEDIKVGDVTPELLVQQDDREPSSATLKPASAIVDMLNKRMKAINKKIVRFFQHFPTCFYAISLTSVIPQQRIQSYSNNPEETLNEDQKRTLKTLPGLEGALKELEEVKKAVEVCVITGHTFNLTSNNLFADSREQANSRDSGKVNGSYQGGADSLC